MTDGPLRNSITCHKTLHRQRWKNKIACIFRTMPFNKWPLFPATHIVLWTTSLCRATVWNYSSWHYKNSMLVGRAVTLLLPSALYSPVTPCDTISEPRNWETDLLSHFVQFFSLTAPFLLYSSQPLGLLGSLTVVSRKTLKVKPSFVSLILSRNSLPSSTVLKSLLFTSIIKTKAVK